MIYFDTFVRFLGINLLLILAILTLRDVKYSRSAVYLVLSCISTAALLVGFSPGFFPPPEYVFLIARFVDVPHMIFIWLFALSLFDKNFVLRPMHIMVALAYCLPILLLRLSQFGMIKPVPSWIITAINLGTIPIIAHMFWVTLRGRADDLNEDRRAARYYFVGLIGIVAVTSALTDLFMTGEYGAYLPTAKAIIFLPSTIFACWWLFKIKSTALSFGMSAPVKNHTLEGKDFELSQKLDAEMRVNQAFLDAKLSISELARRIGTPSYRVRAVINQSLGHQNFSVYVNRFRVEAIKRALADPANLDKSILDLALAHGFNSLSPFNRAFREIEGMTPSQYRQHIRVSSTERK